jgi:hypothetical protein
VACSKSKDAEAIGVIGLRLRAKDDEWVGNEESCAFQEETLNWLGADLYPCVGSE